MGACRAQHGTVSNADRHCVLILPVKVRNCQPGRLPLVLPWLYTIQDVGSTVHTAFQNLLSHPGKQTTVCVGCTVHTSGCMNEVRAQHGWGDSNTAEPQYPHAQYRPKETVKEGNIMHRNQLHYETQCLIKLVAYVTPELRSNSLCPCVR